MRDAESEKLVERAFGIADDQCLEEFESAQKDVTEADKKAGNWAALKKRIEEEEK